MNLIWFRRDLRVDDNPALFHACKNSFEPTLAVYFYFSEQFVLHHVGANQQRLILKALQNLQQKLLELNIPLLLIEEKNYAEAPDALVKLCAEHNISDVYFNCEYSVNEKNRDKNIESALKEVADCHAYHDQSLTVPAQIVNQSGTGYKVFSAYARAVHQHLSNQPVYCFPIPEKKPVENLNLLHNKNCEQLSIEKLILKLNDKLSQPDIQLPLINEDNLNQKLVSFCKNDIHDYKKQRDFPAINGTSDLSSGLAVGAISARRCYQLAKEMAGEYSASWINELVWRDFYRAVMWHFPRVSKGQAFNSVDKLINWSENNNHLLLWQNGQTGIPIIDAAMNQLVQTGWMHNRLRMIVASYLTKNLWIDWRKGEKFFAKHLFDYDFASNNGGWQWCASVGTDAAPYFRVFNPATQQLRFDPEAEFIKQWLPQLSHFSAKQIHQFESKPLPGYSPCMVNLKSSRKQAIETFKIAKSNQQFDESTHL